MKMKDDYTEDELLGIAKKIQRIIYGNISQNHSEAFQYGLSYTTAGSGKREELLDGINYIVNSDNNIPDLIKRDEILSSMFSRNSREYQVTRYAFTFKPPTLEDIVGELKSIISEFGTIIFLKTYLIFFPKFVMLYTTDDHL